MKSYIKIRPEDLKGNIKSAELHITIEGEDECEYEMFPDNKEWKCVKCSKRTKDIDGSMSHTSWNGITNFKPSKHEPKNGGCDGCIADMLKNGATVQYAKSSGAIEIEVKNKDAQKRMLELAKLEEIRELVDRKYIEGGGFTFISQDKARYLLSLIDKAKEKPKYKKIVGLQRVTIDKYRKALEEVRDKGVDYLSAIARRALKDK